MKQRMLCFAVDSQINLISTHLFLWALSGLLTHVSLKSVSAFVRYSANRNIILKNTIWDEEDHCWTARYSHWELNKWLHVQFLLHVVLWSWHAGAFTLKSTCLLVNTNSTATFMFCDVNKSVVSRSYFVLRVPVMHVQSNVRLLSLCRWWWWWWGSWWCVQSELIVADWPWVVSLVSCWRPTNTHIVHTLTSLSLAVSCQRVFIQCSMCSHSLSSPIFHYLSGNLIFSFFS